MGDIPDTPGVHGIALAPEFGRGFVSNGREGTVSVFDLNSLKVLNKIKVGENPDAILYDPASKRVFTFNGRSDDVTAIDAAKGEVVGTIKVDGKPEFAASDAKGEIFVNIEDKSELMALDPNKLEVKSRWPLAPCEEPSGLAIDRKHRRLFSGCGNKVMAIVDADSGKVVSTLPIGGGVDAAALRSGNRTGLRFLRRRRAHGRARRLAGQIQCRRKCSDQARRAHHGTRSGEASNFSGDRGIRAGTCPDRGPASSPAGNFARQLCGPGGGKITAAFAT